MLWSLCSVSFGIQTRRPISKTYVHQRRIQQKKHKHRNKTPYGNKIKKKELQYPHHVASASKIFH
ncbi:hypothetical protein P167DRAFT_103327 [Morchella conica CCBAS932]|uniref:Uncharacterized protein n=1 Tax=Morchella conica CCBAS932 TaxID=1392247 RepID=A0A3N4KST5_9PEZI|nr:hypothetical protein P167DRAFT_103327 [Morchella conica CCBAS932]